MLWYVSVVRKAYLEGHEHVLIIEDGVSTEVMDVGGEGGREGGRETGENEGTDAYAHQ